jgi:hypothetical protein
MAAGFPARTGLNLHHLLGVQPCGQITVADALLAAVQMAWGNRIRGPISRFVTQFTVFCLKFLIGEVMIGRTLS